MESGDGLTEGMRMRALVCTGHGQKVGRATGPRHGLVVHHSFAAESRDVILDGGVPS